MFLKVQHQNLNVYSSAKNLIVECYKFTNILPPSEKFNLVVQIRRASISVLLNIAEGASRKSKIERKRYFEISRGSVIEIDAALDAAFDLGYFKPQEWSELSSVIAKTFSLLCGLIDSSN